MGVNPSHALAWSIALSQLTAALVMLPLAIAGCAWALVQRAVMDGAPARDVEHPRTELEDQTGHDATHSAKDAGFKLANAFNAR